MIEYAVEKTITLTEFKSVLDNSTLGERRPVNEPESLKAMLQHGNLIVTARDKGKLIGVSRSLTDFQFCTYLSDLAVDTNYQKQGIGKRLIRLTKEASPKAKLILLSAPAAIEYYPKIGMRRYEHCFLLDDIEELK